MDNVAELLFELANADRTTILSEINRKPLRLSEVARKLSVTVPEASRHLERLREAKLIEKDSSASFRVTPYGRVALLLLAPFGFFRDNREFFLSHDLSSLPPGFVQRIGELSEYQYLDRLDDMLALVERVISGARKYVWLMSDQQMRQSYPHEHAETVSVRLVFPNSIGTEVIERVRKRIGPSLGIGLVEDVSVAIAMNETVAVICFSGLDGRMDFSRGFTGDTAIFHGWCRDLYAYFWENSRKIGV